MGKYKFYFFVILACLTQLLPAQDQEETWGGSRSSGGRTNFTSPDGKYRFTAGGRFTMDAAYIQKDVLPRNSGSRIKEARFNTSLKIKKMNIFVEVDFERSKVTLKDVTVRHNFTDHSFIKIGHYTEPFSANYLTTTAKVPFIGRPSTATAFAPPRSLGMSYRHYQKHFWFEGGVFGENINQQYDGSDGYSLTGRLLAIPIAITNSHLHLGVSGSYRVADTRAIDEDGSSYFNRKLNYSSALQNYIDSDKVIAAYIGSTDPKKGGAKDQVQIDLEVMDIYRNFYWRVEYIQTKVNRVFNKNKIIEIERDGGLYPGTWSDIEWKYGEMRPLKFYGYYAQASYLVFGGNYKYNRSTATITRLTKRALELSARYNYTNLNDVEGDFINGKFYTDEGLNQSVAGGITSAISVSANYVFNANMRLVLEYTNQKVDNYTGDDESINIFQGRIQVVF